MNHLHTRLIVIGLAILFSLNSLSSLLFTTPILAQETTTESTLVAPPTLTTDKADYSPLESAVISGTGFTASTEYSLTITSGSDYTFTSSVTSNEAGEFSYTYQLDGTYRPVYTAQALLNGTVVATVTFTDSAASLSQCGNGSQAAPDNTPCQTGTEWENGNLNASKSHYFEGDSVPYRMVITGVSLGSHTLTIEWDTTKGGKHALDYLTTFNRSVVDANPCAGIAGCGAATTFAIPADPQVTGAGVTPIAGNFTLYGGTITGVSAYTYDEGTGFAGDKSAKVTITFNATQSNPVLAWGGHIATRADWGLANSAVNIPGSPYHTRLVDLDGAGGNQDRSLSADAVIFPGSITVIKNATPEGSASFPFSASPSPLSNFNLIDDNTATNTKLFSNITDFKNYTITENTPAGWAFTGASCSVTAANGGSQNVSGATATINLKEGENVSCTYNNQQQQGTLIVRKTVINDNGGTKTASDFTFQVNGDTAVAFEADGQNNLTVNAGTYNVTEPSVTGYATTYDNCADVVVAPNGSATCTITNNDVAPTLTLVKTVSNTHGGQATAADFQGKIDNNNVAWTVAQTLSAGAHTASETNIPGYTASVWGGDCAANGSVTLAVGDVKTCSITNSDQPGTLIVRKIVDNNNGGTSEANDFSFQVNGGTAAGFEADGQNDLTVNAGTYSVTEPAATGYDTFYDNCTDVVIPNGGTATCTITNDDQPAHVVVIKHVINDNGGTATASNFMMHRTGTAGTADFAGAETPGVDTQVNAGTFSVSETNLDGYASSLTGDCSGSIANGQTKTCTLTNDDVAPSLTLVKQMLNDHGGSANVTDWTLSATGPTSINGAGGAVSGATFSAGSYDLSESTGPSGYTASSWVCQGGSQTGAQITLTVGQSATCTIVNDDIQPRLTVVKTVINNNGGAKTVSDFPLFVGATSVTSGTQTGFTAGVYTVSETPDAGYTPSVWGGDCAANGSVTLAVGDVKTCSITNDDKPGTLIVQKVVINDAGGTATPVNFSFQVNGASALAFEADGQNDLTVNAGTYSVTEPAATGYATTYDNCSDVIIPNGGTATCTITNNDIAPTLTVIKHIAPTSDTGLFNLRIDGSTAGTGGNVGDDGTTGAIPLIAGAHTVSETAGTATDLSNYTAVIGGDCAANGTITLALAENKTCVITNTRKAGLTIVKDATPNDLEDFHFGGTLGAFILDDDQGVSGSDNVLSTSQVFTKLLPADYTITETQPNQYWELDQVTCVDANSQPFAGMNLNGMSLTVTLGAGDQVTCTFVNVKESPTRTQGFWQTHTQFTTAVFAGMSNTMTIGSAPHKGTVESIGKVFGAYYSSIPKKTDNKKRLEIDQARMQLLQQLVTAKLNCAAFGCASNVQTMIAAADTAYASNSTSAILTSAGLLDAYNNSGDTIVVSPAPGSATPNASIGLADKAFWNAP